MGPVLAFWAVSMLTGALALPVAFRLLRRLPDAGAGMSFALGLVLTGYGYFTLRTASVLPPGRGGYLLALALLGLLSGALAWRDRRFEATLRRLWPVLITVAGLFTMAFFLFVAFRSYVPNIVDTEEPMDFMYLNASVASPDYPPHDPWLAGEKASYYYFGYVQIGVLTELAGVPTSTGYNLGLAFTFAAAATGMGSLAYALARWALGRRGRSWAFGAAVTAVVLLLGAGSLGGVFELAAAHEKYNDKLFETFGVDWMLPCKTGQHKDCYSGPVSPRTTSWYPTQYWWWWNDTRIIPSTITEFPVFSFFLGDMHPHVMSIPLVLLTLGLSAAAFRAGSSLSWRSLLKDPVEALIAAVILGALAFENAWDLPTFAAVFGVAVLARNFRRAPPVPAMGQAALYLLPIFAVAVAAYLPWYLTFASQADGFFPYVGRGTRPAHAFLQFGPLLLAALLALTWSLRRADLREAAETALWGTIWVPLLPLGLWVGLAIFHGQLGDAVDARRAGGWVTLAAYAAATWALATVFVVLAGRRHPAAFAAGLGATGALLLLGCELFYIGDIFAGSAPRLNTVFKLTYQAWILLSAAGAVAFVVALRRAWSEGSRPALVAMPVATLLAGALVYGLIAIPQRTDGFSKPTAVDGLHFVAESNPDEYALTRWVEEHVPPGDIILEATGRTWGRDPNGTPIITDGHVDYTEASRISGRTGRQTPIGWAGHEVQWRGDDPKNQAEFGRRQDLVDRAYTTKDPATVLDVMRQTGARWLVVGALETVRYPGDLMPDYASFLDVAFQSGKLRVYVLPTFETVAGS